MAVEIQARYDGGLRCTLVHGPSGSILETDAPADNCGKGERFSPTDLIASALATCILTTIGILAQRKGWDVSGMRATVIKEMSADPPRRIARLPVELWMPRHVPVEARQQIENTARACPVHHSIHPAIKAPVRIHWEA